MALRACKRCGRAIERTPVGVCDRCLGQDVKLQRRLATGHWSAGRDRAEQARFRRGLIEADGEQCMRVLANGLRCPETVVQAHHGRPGHPDELLCSVHHREVDEFARGV